MSESVFTSETPQNDSETGPIASFNPDASEGADTPAPAGMDATAGAQAEDPAPASVNDLQAQLDALTERVDRLQDAPTSQVAGDADPAPASGPGLGSVVDYDWTDVLGEHHAGRGLIVETLDRDGTTVAKVAPLEVFGHDFELDDLEPVER